MNTTCQYCGAIDAPICCHCEELIKHLTRFFIIARKPNTLALIATAKQHQCEAEEKHRLANEQMVENLKAELGVRKPVFMPSEDFPGWEHKAATDPEPAYRPIGSTAEKGLLLHREVAAHLKAERDIAAMRDAGPRAEATGGDQ